MQSQRNRTILLITGLLLWTSLYSFWAYYTPYLSGLGLPSATVGIIAGSFGMVSLVIKLPLGIAADRLKKYKVIATAGLGFMIISDIIMLNFASPQLLLIARVMNGITSSTWLVFYTMGSAGGSTSDASRMQSVQFFGEFSGYILSGFVYNRFGMRGTFIMSICCAGAAFLLSLFLNDAGISKEPVKPAELVMVVKDRNMIVCALLAIIYQFCIFATAYNFTQNYVADMGASSLQLGYINAIRLLCSAFSCRLVLMQFFRRRSSVFNLLLGFGALTIYCFGIPHCTSILPVYILSIIGGISSGFGLSYLTSKCLENIPVNARTAGMGFFQCAFAIGVSFGPTAMGFLLENTAGYTTAFHLMGVLAAVGILLVFVLMPSPRAAVQRQEAGQDARGV